MFSVKSQSLTLGFCRIYRRLLDISSVFLHLQKYFCNCNHPEALVLQCFGVIISFIMAKSIIVFLPFCFTLFLGEICTKQALKQIQNNVTTVSNYLQEIFCDLSYRFVHSLINSFIGIVDYVPVKLQPKDQRAGVKFSNKHNLDILRVNHLTLHSFCGCIIAKDKTVCIEKVT